MYSGIKNKVHPFLLETPLHSISHISVLFAENLTATLNNGNPGAQPAEGLRHLC